MCLSWFKPHWSWCLCNSVFWMKAVSCFSLHLLSFIKYTDVCVCVFDWHSCLLVRRYSPLVCDKLWVINHVWHSDRDVTVYSCRRAAWVCLIYLCDLSDCRSVMWRLTSVWITWPGKRMKKWAFSTATAWAATRSAPRIFVTFKTKTWLE